MQMQAACRAKLECISYIIACLLFNFCRYTSYKTNVFWNMFLSWILCKYIYTYCQ